MTEREIAEMLREVPMICGHCAHRGNEWGARCSNGALHSDFQSDHDAMAHAVVERVVGPLKTSLARLESSTHCTICNRPHYHYGVGR